jgi:lipoprotein-releasing system ATP-binding protein
MSDTSAAVLQCTGLVKRYDSEPDSPRILNGLDFEVRAGESVAIVGASGSGKSTLLHLLGGLDDSSEGQVFWNGQDISRYGEAERGLLRNQHLGFVYQFHHLLPEFTAIDNVAMPLRLRGIGRSQARERASAWLDKVGLEHRKNGLPGQLSGGERQRVAVARALVTEPKALLADEPTGNLDTHTADLVFAEMQRMNQELNVALVLVTHANSLALRCRRVLQLRDGRLHE